MFYIDKEDKNTWISVFLLVKTFSETIVYLQSILSEHKILSLLYDLKVEFSSLHELFKAIQFENHGAGLNSRSFESNKNLFPIYYNTSLYYIISLNKLEDLKVYKQNI